MNFTEKCAKTTCRSCGHVGVKPVLDLGTPPLVDTLVTKDRLNAPEGKYPLQVGYCPKCTLVAVLDTVPPQEVFHEDYAYYASFSESWLNHCRKNALNLVETRKLNKDSLVIELASNDGYLLKNFVEKGIPVLGIDPAPGPVAAAKKIGVNSVCEFFTADYAKKLAKEGKRADVVIANNVMAHVADLNGFIEGIHTILKDDGVLVTESAYVKDLVDHTEFDTIYHEHLCYYSATALDNLFSRHGLYLNDIERLPTHGGSIRSYAGRKENRSQRIKDLLKLEKDSGVTDFRYYQNFTEKVHGIKEKLLKMLHELKAQGKRVAAYGASAKGSTMLCYVGITSDLVEFVVDKNVHKQGKYMPGTHNPILAPEAVAEKKPDYMLLLVWNLKDEILKQQKAYRDAGGKFIIPVPEPTIV